MDKDFIRSLARYLDFSCVQAQNTQAEIDDMVLAAKQYGPAAVFALPCYTSYLARQIREIPSVKLGGVVGFPSGAQSTTGKRLEAEELLALGCRELDMVMAIGKLKDGDISYVERDIYAVVEEAQGVPVKVIVEAGYLSATELELACKTAVCAGAQFVKTSTGFSSAGATVEDVRLMKRAAEGLKVKAAGGIRTWKDTVRMLEAGADRIGASASVAIVTEAEKIG